MARTLRTRCEVGAENCGPPCGGDGCGAPRGGRADGAGSGSIAHHLLGGPAALGAGRGGTEMPSQVRVTRRPGGALRGRPRCSRVRGIGPVHGSSSATINCTRMSANTNTKNQVNNRDPMRLCERREKPRMPGSSSIRGRAAGRGTNPARGGPAAGAVDAATERPPITPARTGAGARSGPAALAEPAGGATTRHRSGGRWAACWAVRGRRARRGPHPDLVEPGDRRRPGRSTGGGPPAAPCRAAPRSRRREAPGSAPPPVPSWPDSWVTRPDGHGGMLGGRAGAGRPRRGPPADRHPTGPAISHAIGDPVAVAVTTAVAVTAAVAVAVTVAAVALVAPGLLVGRRSLASGRGGRRRDGAAADAEHDGLAGQRGAVGVLADDGAAFGGVVDGAGGDVQPRVPGSRGRRSGRGPRRRGRATRRRRRGSGRSGGGSGSTGWPSSSGFIVPNQVSAGVLPPKMLPLPARERRAGAVAERAWGRWSCRT